MYRKITASQAPCRKVALEWSKTWTRPCWPPWCFYLGPGGEMRHLGARRSSPDRPACEYHPEYSLPYCTASVGWLPPCEWRDQPAIRRGRHAALKNIPSGDPLPGGGPRRGALPRKRIYSSFLNKGQVGRIKTSAGGAPLCPSWPLARWVNPSGGPGPTQRRGSRWIRGCLVRHDSLTRVPPCNPGRLGTNPAEPHLLKSC